MFLTKKSSASKQQKPKNKALGGWGDDDEEHDQSPGINSNINYKKFNQKQSNFTKVNNNNKQPSNFNSINLLDGDAVPSSYTAVTTFQKSSSASVKQSEVAQVKRKTSSGQTSNKNIQAQIFYTAQQLANMNNIQCQCKIVEAVLIPGGIRVKPNDSLLNQFYNETKSLSIPIVGSLLICHLYNPDAQFQIKAKSLYAIQFLAKKSVQYSVYFKLHVDKITESPNCYENNQNYLKIKKNLLSLLGAVIVKPTQKQDQLDFLAKEGINYVDPGYNQGDQSKVLSGIVKKNSQRQQKQKVQGGKKLISPSQAKIKQKKVFEGPKKNMANIKKQINKEHDLLGDFQIIKESQKELIDLDVQKNPTKDTNLLEGQDFQDKKNLTFEELMLQQNKQFKKTSYDFTF